MNPTVEGIIQSFEAELAKNEDLVDPDPEVLLISAILYELKSVRASFAGMDVDEDLRLAVACSKVPGLLHLAQLY